MGNNSLQTAGQLLENYLSRDCTCENFSLQSILDRLEEMDLKNHTDLVASELGGATLFASLFKGEICYDPDTRTLYRFDGRRWRPDAVAGETLVAMLATAINTYATTLWLEQASDFYKLASKWLNHSFRMKVLADVKNWICVASENFDSNPYLLNVRNGTLDLRNMTFRKHDAADLITRLAPVEYDADAKSDEWEQFLDGIFPGKTDFKKYVQRIMGYTLIGKNPEEVLFLLCGKTRSGKDTLISTIQNMLGDYACTVSASTLASRKYVNGSSPSEDIVRLRGARLAVVNEPDKRLKFDSGLLKQITGNSRIVARGMYARSSIEYTPCFKLVVVANHIPDIDDVTVWDSGRIHMVPFDRHLEEDERDISLKEKFASSPETLSAILNWCLEGLKCYQTNRLAAPVECKNMVDRIRDDTDILKVFMDEVLVTDEGSKIDLKTVHQTYMSWCTAHGYDRGNYNTFLHDIEPRAKVLFKQRLGGRDSKQVTALIGYRFSDGASCYQKDGSDA